MGARKFRAVIFTLVFATMVVPAAGAAPARKRDGNVPGLIEEFGRLVCTAVKKFGTPATALPATPAFSRARGR